VLLAGLTDAQIDEYIASTRLEKLTVNTVTEPAKFRATLMKVRAQGYALVDQELEEGVRSLAAPILNASGSVMAAMNVSCHATRATVSRMREEFLPHLLATAAEVSDRANALRVG
jgi:IclR family pca regulon transcriptional regulator